MMQFLLPRFVSSCRPLWARDAFAESKICSEPGPKDSAREGGPMACPIVEHEGIEANQHHCPRGVDVKCLACPGTCSSGCLCPCHTGGVDEESQSMFDSEDATVDWWTSSTSCLDAANDNPRTDDTELGMDQGQPGQLTKTMTQGEWLQVGAYIRKMKRKCFAFTLDVDTSSTEGQTTLTLQDVGGSALGSTTIAAGEFEKNEDINVSLFSQALALVERHLSYFMRDKNLELDASNVEILPGSNDDCFTVTVILLPAKEGSQNAAAASTHVEP